jgi:hypothetical protein
MKLGGPDGSQAREGIGKQSEHAGNEQELLFENGNLLESD